MDAAGEHEAGKGTEYGRRNGKDDEACIVGKIHILTWGAEGARSLTISSSLSIRRQSAAALQAMLAIIRKITDAMKIQEQNDDLSFAPLGYCCCGIEIPFGKPGKGALCFDKVES
jgi:hypothetical protein